MTNIDTKPEIKIYVACLAAYNNGILHGRWIDAAQDVEDIKNEITTMLAESPEKGAEEYVIHGVEGFGELKIGEYESLERVAELAKIIEEHGELGLKLLKDDNDVEHAKKMLEDRYAGKYKSFEDYLQELTEETTSIPMDLQYYIDYEKMARDYRHDYTIIETGFEEVHVFYNA